MIVVTFKDGKNTHEVTLTDADEFGNEYDDTAAVLTAGTQLRNWAGHGTTELGDGIVFDSIRREA